MPGTSKQRGKPAVGLALALVGALAVGIAVWWSTAPVAPQVRAKAPFETPSVEPHGAAPDLRELVQLDEEPQPAPAASAEPVADAADEPDLVFHEVVGEAHPDPVEHGNALLDLRLIDKATGAAVASHVELWRLDAPENEHWTSGDQLQDQADVPLEGWIFTRLPEGRYRVVCHREAWGEEPPEIEVTAPRTRLDVALVLPREFRIRLDVRDRFGNQVAGLALEERSFEYLDERQPWRGERTQKSGFGTAIGYGASRGRGKPWSLPGPQPPEGFDLGLRWEADRGGHRTEVLVMRTESGGRVRLFVPPRCAGDLRLVAVVLTAEEVEPLVRFPSAISAPLELDVFGKAVERDSGLPDGGWQQAPVKIRIQAAGVGRFSDTWKPADGDLPSIVLRPDP
jgi:hypothetical protein